MARQKEYAVPARRPRLQFASPAASPCVLTVTAISHTMYRYACLEVMNCKAACPPVAAPTTPASGLARRVPFPPTQAIKQGDACRGMWGGWVGTQPSHAQPTARSRAPPALPLPPAVGAAAGCLAFVSLPAAAGAGRAAGGGIMPPLAAAALAPGGRPGTSRGPRLQQGDG